MNIQKIEPGDMRPCDIKRVFNIFNKTTECILFDNQNECSAPIIKALIHQWHKEGSTVLYKAGVFDLMHNNHLLFLTHLRMIGAIEHSSKEGINNPSDNTILSTMSSRKIRIIISLDSDEHVRIAKGFKSSKSYSPRPMLSWSNRATMVAHQQMTLEERGRNLVDAVTSHGIKSCIKNSCPHTNDVELASYINPDITVINKETFNKTHLLHKLTSKIITVNEHDLSISDPLLGGAIKTSSIIKRAKTLP